MNKSCYNSFVDRLQVVFRGAWALLILGIILAVFHEQLGVSPAWIIFCLTFSLSIILVSVKNNKLVIVVAIVLLVISLIALVAAVFQFIISPKPRTG
jgi:hypothetical protein